MLCRLGFEKDSVAVNIVALLGLCVGFHVLAYLLLRFKKPRFLDFDNDGGEGTSKAAVAAANGGPGSHVMSVKGAEKDERESDVVSAV